MWAVRYYRVFKTLNSARLGKDLEHGYNFILTWIGSLCYFTFHLLTYSLIISKFRFPGWPVSHMWVLLFNFEIVTYLAFYLFWRGMIHTVRDIRFGTFDAVISKPISPRFIAFFRNGGTHNLFSAVIGLVFLIGALVKFHLPVTFLSVISYLLSLLVSLWTFHCISVIFISLNFIFGYLPFTQGVIFQIQEFYKYPSSLFYGSPFLLRLVLIPLTAIMSFPVSMLLIKPFPVSLYYYFLGSAAVLSLVSHYVWHYSLNRYSSSGS